MQGVDRVRNGLQEVVRDGEELKPGEQPDLIRETSQPVLVQEEAAQASEVADEPVVERGQPVAGQIQKADFGVDGVH